MTKPRLLFLCGQAPWQRNGGALIRNAMMIAALGRRFTVDLVTAEDSEVAPPADLIDCIDDVATFPRSERVRAGWGRALAAAQPGASSLTAGWVSRELREYVAERLGRYPYAAIQVDLPMADALPRRDAIPIVYNAHNCESELLARRARTEPPHVALPMAIDALRVRRIERALVARAALVAACCEADARDFRRLYPGVRGKLQVVPNGIEVARYAALRVLDPEPATVVVSGSMDWRPNVLGLRWFVRSVWPLLQQRVPGVRLRIAGRMKAPLIAEFQGRPNVELIPNPASMEPHLAAATVVAAPVLASSGTRLRVLEAWAASRPVVTTTAGAAGLDYEPDADLLVADGADAFAAAIAKALQDARLRTVLAAGGRRRVEAYDWERIGDAVLAAYERCVPLPRPRIPTLREDVLIGSKI